MTEGTHRVTASHGESNALRTTAMIKALRIRGYRCFDDFRMEDIARVNLLVGKNNSGKTALLEAIELVGSIAVRANALWAALWRRGERYPEDEEDRPRRPAEYDISHLFHGHRIRLGSRLEIGALCDTGHLAVSLDVVPPDKERQLYPVREGELEGGNQHSPPLALRLKSTDLPGALTFPLTSRGGLDTRVWPREYASAAGGDQARPTTLITTDSLSSYAASQYWRSIALTEEERSVVEALRILDPDVQRIAFLPVSRFEGSGARGGLLVKHAGAERPLPIGSLGDGMWRMFSIAVALISARGGILLVDEIDTGFHYSAMEQMWRMVLQTAQRHLIQVFATTHSSDCIDSLAAICRKAVPGEVSLQRMEVGRPEAVAYSEQEIWTAAQHGIETR
jgi:hypothetical protein